MLINVFLNTYYQQSVFIYMKPPVGIPGKDVFHIPNYCDNCNKHFLIDAEFEIHKRGC